MGVIIHFSTLYIFLLFVLYGGVLSKKKMLKVVMILRESVL